MNDKSEFGWDNWTDHRLNKLAMDPPYWHSGEYTYTAVSTGTIQLISDEVEKGKI